MKDKIIFKSFLPDISFSLEKNKPLNFSWFKKAYEDYKKNPASMHTAKCPGINSIIKTGWIQKLIKTLLLQQMAIKVLLIGDQSLTKKL